MNHRACSYFIALRVSGQISAVVQRGSKDVVPEGLKIPVIENYELNAFLSEEDSVDLSTDDAAQYELFLRNQLDFEEWRNNQTTY